MDRLRLQDVVLDLMTLDGIHLIPSRVKHLLVCQPIENAITAQDDEVMEVRLQSELGYLWLCNDDTFFTSILGPFGLNVTKCAGH